ncbi:CHAT domain-containing protein [Nocardia ignorata]|uniref:CHAT domain-containing protein n=1 Tax=Nocardia ignorata TaxID=145285 RepID=A0A4R6P2N1_NOCIG|nr:CHAT domain-containing protein [Nocardia ignorata]TDP31466.1 CHAT domain-containing protein [Nocardia ignorata]
MEIVVEMLVIARTRKVPDWGHTVRAEAELLEIADEVDRVCSVALPDDPALALLSREASSRAGASRFARTQAAEVLDETARRDDNFAAALWQAVHLGLEPLEDTTGDRRGSETQAGAGSLTDLRKLNPAIWLNRVRTWPRAHLADASAESVIADYAPYPRLEVAAVILAHTPVPLTVGLGAHYDPATTVAGPVRIPYPDQQLDLRVDILVDPRSFTLHGPSTVHLPVTGDDPYPVRTLRLTAHTAPELTPERTIRLIYRLGDRIVGLASRTITVTTDRARLDAFGFRPPQHRMLDLMPLVESAPPDLVLVLFRADERDETYVWEAFPFGGRATLADGERRSRIDGSARDLATHTSRLVVEENFRGPAAYDMISGYGDLIQSAIPAGIRTVLRDLVDASAEPPTMLLLTEEAFVPWELAVLDPPMRSAFGGDAPFLGAHVAMSRWPFSTDGAGAGVNTHQHTVRRHAAVAAKYPAQWKSRFRELPHAVAEADRFNGVYAPVVAVAPTRHDVVACLSGELPVDLLHLAVHGDYDPSQREDGLVFPDPRTTERPEFLTSLAVRGLRNDTAAPFVFVNACLMAAGDTILGSYAGFAAAVLRTGAVGVVAPIWSVDDADAARVAQWFYRHAYGESAVPVAELLRRLRAEYTRADVTAAGDRAAPTALAYQAFGHPRLTLLRTTPER